MAKIPVYEAPTRELHAEEKGFAAQETAGRRIGPAFDRAATDLRDVGNVTASISKERLWPWDILELDQRLGDNGNQRNRDQGVNVRAGGSSDSDPFGQFRDSHATGRAGRVVADMANELTANPLASGAGLRGKGKLVSPGGLDDPGNKYLTSPLDPRQKTIIADPRALQPIQFPDKVAGGPNVLDPNKDPNATKMPAFKQEQPIDPDALRREATQRQVFRDANPPLPGYGEDAGYGGGGFSSRPGGGYAQPLPPDWNDGRQTYQDAYPPTDDASPPSSDFGSRVWGGIKDFFGSVSGTDTQPPSPTTSSEDTSDYTPTD